jgi:LAO/AO transport system kinase
MTKSKKTHLAELDTLFQGDRRALAKAITLIEKDEFRLTEEFFELMQCAWPVEAPTLRVAVSGPPGAGKSTFINQLGLVLVSNGLKVAVLPVDPTSPTSGGSILGDKTRMSELTKSSHAYIRPSPSKLAMGGLSPATRESMYLCEMACYDVVILETVGVGQGEYHAQSQVDLFILVLPPASGDDLQGLKKGIIEMSDVIVFNKADNELRSLAHQAASDYQSSITLGEQTGPWLAKALSSHSHEEVLVLWKDIEQKIETLKSNGQFFQRRKQQEVSWFKELIAWRFDRNHQQFLNSAQTKSMIDALLNNKISALDAYAQNSKSIY